MSLLSRLRRILRALRAILFTFTSCLFAEFSLARFLHFLHRVCSLVRFRSYRLMRSYHPFPLSNLSWNREMGGEQLVLLVPKKTDGEPLKASVTTTSVTNVKDKRRVSNIFIYRFERGGRISYEWQWMDRDSGSLRIVRVVELEDWRCLSTTSD